MKRLFRKGQRVKSLKDGKVMEVINYIKTSSKYLVECKWFDMEKKEVRINRYEEDNLKKAS